MYKDLRIIHTFYCISHQCLRHYLRLPEWRNHVRFLPILWTGYSLVLPLAQAHPLDARIVSIKRTPAWEFSHRMREASPKNTTRPYRKKTKKSPNSTIYSSIGTMSFDTGRFVELDLPLRWSLCEGRLSIICENKVHFQGTVRYAALVSAVRSC